MKFKNRKGALFIFNGGYEVPELTLKHLCLNEYQFNNVIITTDFKIRTSDSSYSDIQIAFNLMQIIKNKGLVESEKKGP